MHTTANLWSHIAEFFLESEMLQTSFIEEISIHVLFSIPFFEKSCRLRDNVKKKKDKTGQATEDNIISRKNFACWINKARDTHSKYVNLISFPPQQWLGERDSVIGCTYIACLVITHAYLTSQFVVYNSVYSLNIRFRILTIAAISTSETFPGFFSHAIS